MAKADLRLKPSRAAKVGQPIASLDIGSSKITCLIGRFDPEAKAGFAFLGGGRQQARGFKDGSITDMEALERSVRLAVEDAERQATQRWLRIAEELGLSEMQVVLSELLITLSQPDTSRLESVLEGCWDAHRTLQKRTLQIRQSFETAAYPQGKTQEFPDLPVSIDGGD